ncbi:MAG TPA: hypothetical protein VFH06_05825, partial [Candidatus Saccharimonadales bacterium]|nr:hypothetical protein [Candidatus Saccharimonadales bacterium]
KEMPRYEKNLRRAGFAARLAAGCQHTHTRQRSRQKQENDQGECKTALELRGPDQRNTRDTAEQVRPTAVGLRLVRLDCARTLVRPTNTQRSRHSRHDQCDQVGHGFLRSRRMVPYNLTTKE